MGIAALRACRHVGFLLLSLHSVQFPLAINFIELGGGNPIYKKHPPLSAKENAQKVEFVVFEIK